MSNPVSNFIAKVRHFRLTQLQIFGLAALLAPISYLIGFSLLSPVFLLGGLGMMLGIPLGLAYGAFKTPAAPSAPAAPGSPNTREMEKTILEQLKTELSENRALFDARKGNSNMYARIEYLKGVWESIKASGRLFAMRDAKVLAAVGEAYFWLDQASHLEILAYEAKYAAGALTGPTTAQQLVGEARLLDGQLEKALIHALTALDTALAAS